MEIVSDYLSMDGYAPFIWSAYLVVAFALIGLLVRSVRDVRVREAEMDREEQRAPSRRDR